jgi:multidrug efflux system outer membrane protein
VNNSLLQPIFKGGAILSNYEATKARFDESLAQYQKTVQNSFRETSDAIVTEQKSRISTKEYVKAAQALRSSTELSRDRYLGGLASYLEVLTADQDYFKAQLQVAETRRAQLSAMVNLYRALGGGWQAQKTDDKNTVAVK